MFYYKDDGAYFQDDAGKVYGLNVTAKDKVTEVRELESVSYSLGSETTLPAGACASTLDEIVTRFGVSEKHPLAAKAVKPQETQSTDDSTPVAESSLQDMSRDELVALADEKGVAIKAKDTKSAIIDKIQAGE